MGQSWRWCVRLQPEKGGFVNVNEERKLAQLGPMQLYEPAVTASWRLRMLRRGNVPDEVLARIRCPAHPPFGLCTHTISIMMF